MKLLEHIKVPLSGTSAVVLGRSDIVGNPVAAMLRKLDATVTQCHSRTKNIEDFVWHFLLFISKYSNLLGKKCRRGCCCYWPTRVHQGFLD